MRRRTEAAALVVAAWCAACAGLGAAPPRASGVLTLSHADPARAEAVAAAIRETDPAHPAEVTVRADGDDQVLTVDLEGPVSACADQLDAAVRRELEAHREWIGHQRDELMGQLGADPAAQQDIRRQLEDLSAQRNRNDLRITTPCAVAPPGS